MKKLANFLHNLSIDYLAKTKYTIFISIILVVGSIYSLSTQWLNLGLDFTGGVTIELASDKTVDTQVVRDALHNQGFEDAQVIQYGTEKSVQIKLPPVAANEKQLASQVQEVLSETNYDFQLLGQSVIGPQFGQELIDNGLYALILVLLGIMIYLSLRFQWKLALGAVIALSHDLIITLGFFSVMQFDFDLNVLAALLAILGYSVNDTVVVFDRIRENFRQMHVLDEATIINKSINQTMARTLITSLTTLLSVLALAIFGGHILFGFSIALIVGILIGTYSSIFVASGLALKFKLNKADLTPKKPEEIDDLP